MSWLINLCGRAQVWLGLAGATLLAIGVAFLRGRAEGKKIIEAEQQKRRDHLQEHYNEIDRQAVDPARSYDRLRGLSDD